MRKISAEEKLLRQIVKVQMTDRTCPVLQETPYCTRCVLAIDISDLRISVDFKDVEFGGKHIPIAEPICPKCGGKVEAVINVVH